MLSEHHHEERVYINDIPADFFNKEIAICGWIEDFRDIGKIIFLIVRDVTGSIQITVTEPLVEKLRDITRQSYILVKGNVQPSKSKGFRIEIKASRIDLLNKAINPLPIDPTGRVESGFDKRLDSRALDLRNPKVKSIFILRSKLLITIRKILETRGFIEVNTPKIIGSASEGGANLFSLPYFKKQAYLAQSPQLYKEQLVLALDRVFEIGPYFRAENSHTVRHLSEFTSIDIEAAFWSYRKAMDLAEEIIINSIKEINKTCKQEIMAITGKEIIEEITKIERLSYKECVDDLRKIDIKIDFGEDLSDSMLRKLGEMHRGFYFITDWPSSLKPFYIYDKEEDPTVTESFDLQFGYLELISGGKRQHEKQKLEAKLKLLGLNVTSFEEHLKVFDWGMPPHSGWGLGLDRLMMVITGSQNVREVVLYPRDTERLKP